MLNLLSLANLNFFVNFVTDLPLVVTKCSNVLQPPHTLVPPVMIVLLVLKVVIFIIVRIVVIISTHFVIIVM